MQLRIVNYLLNFISFLKIYAPCLANNNPGNFFYRKRRNNKNQEIIKKKGQKKSKKFDFHSKSYGNPFKSSQIEFRSYTLTLFDFDFD